MAFLGELRVDASSDSLRVISHFVHGIAQRLSLSDKVLFDLEVAVEEAASYIISHAYHGLTSARQDIQLLAESRDGFVQMSLTDWGVPLDPANVRPFDINAPIETRIQGGMGLYFIHTLMDRVERVNGDEIGDPNTLILIKRIEQAPAGLRAPSVLQELNAMRTITEVMASNVELDELLNLILNKLLTTIGAERGTLYLLDEAAGELWSKVLLQEDGSLTEIRVRLGEGISGYVAQTGEILNIPDAYDDPRFNRAIDQTTGYRTRSILTAPMITPKQRIIGVVQLLNKYGGPFSVRDERILAAMAAQAAISIENARLYQQEIEQKILSRELETAHAIQAAFLPGSLPTSDGWDIAAIWQPVRNVAGDFYDFYQLDDGRLAVNIADVSGKGIPAALFMALTVTVLRFGMSLGLPPAEVVDRANELILADQRSRMFATAFVGYLNLHNGELWFASGGHNPAVFYHAHNQTTELVSAPGVAIGLFKDAQFDASSLQLDPGDILVLYTDGITEAIDADEDEFGEDRLQDLIASHADASAEEITRLVLEAVMDFSGDSNFADDATMVVIKRAF